MMVGGVFPLPPLEGSRKDLPEILPGREETIGLEAGSVPENPGPPDAKEGGESPPTNAPKPEEEPSGSDPAFLTLMAAYAQMLDHPTNPLTLALSPMGSGEKVEVALSPTGRGEVAEAVLSLLGRGEGVQVALASLKRGDVADHSSPLRGEGLGEGLAVFSMGSGEKVEVALSSLERREGVKGGEGQSVQPFEVRASALVRPEGTSGVSAEATHQSHAPGIGLAEAILEQGVRPSYRGTPLWLSSVGQARGPAPTWSIRMDIGAEPLWQDSWSQGSVGVTGRSFLLEAGFSEAGPNEDVRPSDVPPGQAGVDTQHPAPQDPWPPGMLPLQGEDSIAFPLTLALSPTGRGEVAEAVLSLLGRREGMEVALSSLERGEVANHSSPFRGEGWGEGLAVSPTERGEKVEVALASLERGEEVKGDFSGVEVPASSGDPGSNSKIHPSPEGGEVSDAAILFSQGALEDTPLLTVTRSDSPPVQRAGEQGSRGAREQLAIIGSDAPEEHPLEGSQKSGRTPVSADAHLLHRERQAVPEEAVGQRFQMHATAGSEPPQTVNYAVLRGRGEKAEMLMRLQPQHLGEVEMHVQGKHSEIAAQIFADRPTTVDLIQTSLPHLRRALEDQGIQVHAFEVGLTDGREGNQGWTAYQEPGEGMPPWLRRDTSLWLSSVGQARGPAPTWSIRREGRIDVVV